MIGCYRIVLLIEEECLNIHGWKEERTNQWTLQHKYIRVNTAIQGCKDCLVLLREGTERDARLGKTMENMTTVPRTMLLDGAMVVLRSLLEGDKGSLILLQVEMRL